MTASLLLVILSVNALVHGGDVPDLPENRIVGGYEVDISQVPFQVSLQVNNGHHCGGSIISPRWVLSAAHCTQHPESQYVILVGTRSIKRGGAQYRVEHIVNHEQYHNPPFANDISLLRTTSVIEFSVNVRAVTLPSPGSKLPAIGSKLRVSGWGKVDDESNPEFLRAVDVELLQYNRCKYEHTDEPRQICAGLPGRNFCNGDSGGPLMNNNVQVGVVAFQAEKNCGGVPGVYSDVTAYRDWIKAHTNV